MGMPSSQTVIQLSSTLVFYAILFHKSTSSTAAAQHTKRLIKLIEHTCGKPPYSKAQLYAQNREGIPPFTNCTATQW